MSELIGEDKTDMIEKEFEKVYNGFDADGNGSINQSEMYNFLDTLFGENTIREIDISAIEEKRKQIEQQQLNEIAKIQAKIAEKDLELGAIDGKYPHFIFIHHIADSLKSEVASLSDKWKLANKKKMHNEYLLMKFENMVFEMNNDKIKHQIKMMKDKIVFLKNEKRSKNG